MSRIAAPAIQSPPSDPEAKTLTLNKKRGVKWWAAAVGILALVGSGVLTCGRFIMDWADRSQKTALSQMDAATEGNLVAKLAPKVANSDVMRGKWFTKAAGVGLEAKVDGMERSIARLESSHGSLRLSVQQEVGMLRQQQQGASETLQRVDDRVDSAMKELGSMSGKLDVLIRMQARHGPL